MRLGETTYVKGDSLENLGERIDEMMVNHFRTEARVEIHSLCDPPWPTERPEGWGVGCWCEYEQRKCDGRKLRGIVALTEHDPYYDVIVPSELFTDCIHVDQITGYGPRAEVV